MVLALTFATACSLHLPEQKEPTGSFPPFGLQTTGEAFPGPFTHAIAFSGTHYYLTGPQQARPPDGILVEGTRLALVRDSGSYSLVTSESGITAYVSTTSFQLID